MEKKRPVFLKARWDDLVMFNYQVDPQILLPYLPHATELDYFDEKAIVSLVGFMFRNTKVFGLQWPYHTNFEEVNLRFYVKHFDGTSWKRGVVFISEIVPSPVIAFFANTLYREHYTATTMKHEKVIAGDEINLKYSWKNKGHWNNMKASAEASLTEMKKGSEEEFIFEHYWGYSKYNENTTIEYGVEHVTWQTHKIKEWKLDCEFAELYGKVFEPYLLEQPLSIFLAKGSDVIIRKPRFIKG